MKTLKATKQNERRNCSILAFQDMPPNIGGAMYDVQLYDVFHSTLARLQAQGAIRTRHTFLKPNAHQIVRSHVRTVPELTDGA